MCSDASRRATERWPRQRRNSRSLGPVGLVMCWNLSCNILNRRIGISSNEIISAALPIKRVDSFNQEKRRSCKENRRS